MVKVTVIAKPPRLEPVTADPFILDLAAGIPRQAAPAAPRRAVA
jgi:hypothetical protein